MVIITITSATSTTSVTSMIIRIFTSKLRFISAPLSIKLRVDQR